VTDDDDDDTHNIAYEHNHSLKHPTYLVEEVAVDGQAVLFGDQHGSKREIKGFTLVFDSPPPTHSPQAPKRRAPFHPWIPLEGKNFLTDCISNAKRSYVTPRGKLHPTLEFSGS
jgi:hypothetical protein